MIKELTLTNFLSFRGPSAVELGPLNILIGGNGVGKSNFIRAVNLLPSLPRNLSDGITELGGVPSSLWHGTPPLERQEGFEFKVRFDLSVIKESGRYLTAPANPPSELEYRIGICPFGLSFSVEEEELSSGEPDLEGVPANVYFRKKSSMDGVVVMNKAKPWETEDLLEEEIRIPWNASLFSLVRGPQTRRGMERLSAALSAIRVYDRWHTGHGGPLRGLQRTDRIPNELVPDGSNLALVINHLVIHNVLDRIEEEMRKFNPRIRNIRTVTQGDSIQLFFSESSLSSAVSASSVSDGTLQYLALLCVLLHPEPAPLVCFEEPECGLHPDAIPMLAQVLRDASQRMQIIVSTHSDRLVDCFSDMPECVLVADRDEQTNETVFERLDAGELKVWLEKYRLGKLWTSGQIGGVIR